MTNTAKLTDAAKSALVSANARQGAVPTNYTESALAELAARGLIGGNGGLTRSGVTARAKTVSEKLDAAF